MKRIIVVAILFFAAGCANHIKFETTPDEIIKEESSTTHNTIKDINGEANNKERLAFELELEELRKSVMSKEKYQTKMEEFTPYEGWRESYEFFIGLSGIPVAVILNVLDIVPFFGAIPNDFLGKQFNMTMSGLNPFMNIESEERSQYKEISRSVIKSEKEEIQKVTPLANKNLQICINENPAGEIITDKLGRFKIDMFAVLSKQSILEEPRKVTVYQQLQAKNEAQDRTSCENPGETSITKIFIRDTGFKLYDAGKHLYYLYNNTTLEPLGAAEAVLALSKLGFEEWSMMAEDNIRKKYRGDSGFIKDFSSMLRNGIPISVGTDAGSAEKADASSQSPSIPANP